jgi:hypothetical protein
LTLFRLNHPSFPFIGLAFKEGGKGGGSLKEGIIPPVFPCAVAGLDINLEYEGGAEFWADDEDATIEAASRGGLR